jgi:pseudolysin
MEKYQRHLFHLVCCVTALTSLTAHAANVAYLWDKTKDVPKLNQFFIANSTKLLTEPLPAQAQLFVLNNNIKPGLYEYRLRNGFIDPDGVTHARYDEYYKNLRVLWADTVVHHKKLQSFNGTIVTGIEKDITSITPRLTAEKAISIAKLHFAKQIGVKSAESIRFMSSELAIYPYSKDDNDNHVAILAYVITYYATGSNKLSANPYYVIDANTGVVLTYFDNLKRAQAQVGTGPGGNTNPALTNGVYNYGIGAAPLAPALVIQTDTPAVGQCTWANRGVGIISLNNQTNTPSIFPVASDNEVNYPLFVVNPCNAGSSYANLNDMGQSPISGAFSPANDMLFYATQTYNLFTNYSIRNPQAPFGLAAPALRYYVNFDSTDASAYNAQCSAPDACNNQQVIFGNGQTSLYPQVGYDVVGHETAHIYMGRTSVLVYANQSGGINEAFADITGAALGAYIGTGVNWFPPYSSTPPLNNPLGISFWTQGALDSRTAPALRYLYNPPLNGSAIDNAANYTQGMGVHDSSGVYNKAFYNLSVALGNGALINYAAILQAYRYIVVANDAYWTSNVDYFNAACGVILAAHNPVYGRFRQNCCYRIIE